MNITRTDLKKMISECILEDLNKEVKEEEDENINTDAEFQRGYAAGVKARVYGGKTEIDPERLKAHYPPAFLKGYKRALYGSWWDRFNNKLTDFAGRMGYSRTR